MNVGNGRHRARSRAARRLLVLFGLTAAIVLLLAGGAFAGYRYERARATTILPGVHIAGVDVGGMTKAQAEQALAPVAARILDRPIDITVGSRNWTKDVGSLGTTVDTNTAVGRALAVSESYGWPARLYHRLMNKPLSDSFDISVAYSADPVKAFVRSIAPELGTTPRDASIDFTDGHLVTVRSRTGRTLRVGEATKRLFSAVQTDAGSVQLAVATLKPKVTEQDLGMMIVVRVSQNRLYLYDGVKLVKTYSVATGQLGIYPTPLGHFEIVNKRINPTWVNPAVTTWGKDEPAFIPPGPDNPLGTRALDLSAPGIRIHGTPNDASIGTWASHGCIRMHIPDSEDLFNRVEVGTPVVIAW
jgi:lipoprotein-anchoring transpeptidase ErfK/SrfK